MKMTVVRTWFGGVFVLVAALLLGGIPANAQVGSTAQINGTVKDSSGGVLPGADVTVTQTNTGFTRSVVTDETGSFTIPNLPIGPYKLAVALSGFRTYVRTGIVLQVSSNPVIPVTLALGELSETVAVEGAAPLVETRNPGVGQVIENARILELPLNGRNPVDLIELAGAAVHGATASTRSMQGSSGGVEIAVAGGLGSSTAYVLDGAMHNNPYDNLGLPLPFPDALQEFRVETGALTAGSGVHTGASVNAVTKSGTNQFHGDAFEFWRNHRFNAKHQFAARRPDGTRQDDGLNRNQFGGTFGGPIRRAAVAHLRAGHGAEPRSARRGIQRAEHRAVGRPEHGAQRPELRQDSPAAGGQRGRSGQPDQSGHVDRCWRSAHYAVRGEVHLLTMTPDSHTGRFNQV
jgi:hypothetical protein